jgi:syntaxin 1B/2/3
VEYVQSGTTALQDAKTLQKKTRKWMCCAIILLLVTAAVIVIVVSCRWTRWRGAGAA